MFDSKQTLTKRLSNAVDLAIDFATLGEYGLEPVGSTPPDELRSCEADQRVRGVTNAHLGELYSLRTPRTAAVAPVCDSRLQANPFRNTANSRGSGRDAARRRGVRDASMAFRATGAA